MPKRKDPEKFANRGEKDCWHPYSLQFLSPSKFDLVVGKILGGQYDLLVPRLRKSSQTDLMN